jgi:hypothetical protein
MNLYICRIINGNFHISQASLLVLPPPTPRTWLTGQHLHHYICIIDIITIIRVSDSNTVIKNVA